MNPPSPKSGIKILEDLPGDGPELAKGDRVRIRYSIRLNQGDYLREDEVVECTVGDRGFIAGFRYGLEGMRMGGARVFRASPHLCYRDETLSNVPKNALLVFEIKRVEPT
jgi:FKBP-type peptidyl-prolyl cis-trans isomerase